MRNSTIIFIFFGLIFAGAILFAFVYLPKLDASSGLSSKNISLELPVDHIDMRYDEKGIVPFCVEKNNGIDIEVKEKTSVFAPVTGVVTNIYPDSERIAIQPTSGVLVYVSPVKNSNVSEGDYVSTGDILGVVDGTSIRISLDNQRDKRFECPFLYMSDSAKKYVSDGLQLTVNSPKRICECSGFGY